MATVNFTGFETGDTSELYTNSGISIQSSTVRTGSYALRANAVTSALAYTYLRGIGVDGTGSTVQTTTSYVRFYFRYATKPGSGEENFFTVREYAAALLKMQLNLTSSGVIKVYDAASTLVLTGSTVLSSGTWYRIEIKCGTGASAAWELKINGVSEGSGTSNMHANAAGFVTLGKLVNTSSQTTDWFYDDFLWSNSAYPGDGQCLLLKPRANGTFQDWSIGAGSGSHYQVVNEIPPDGDTSYLVSPAVSASKYESEAVTLTGTAGITGIINTAKAVSSIKQNSSGGTVQLYVYGADGSSQGTTNYTATASYVLLQLILDTAIHSGSPAWTLPYMDGMETGATSLTSTQVRMTFTGMMVDYTPAVETNVNTIGKYQPVQFNRAVWVGLRQGLTEDVSAPVPQPETNVHTIGKFRPGQVNRQAFLGLYQVDVEDQTAPVETNVENIGKYQPVQFNKAVWVALRQGITEDFTTQPETNIESTGRFIPSQVNRAVWIGLRQGITEDTTAPVETNIENIGRFQATQFNKAAWLGLRENTVESAASITAETNVHTIGRFTPSRINRQAFIGLYQVDVEDQSDPQFNQASQTYTIGRFKPGQMSPVAVAFSNRNYIVEDTGDPNTGQAPQTHSMGRYVPGRISSAAILAGLHQGLTEDTSAPHVESETNVNTIGRYRPTQFTRSAFLPLWKGDNFDCPTEFQLSQVGQYRIQNLDAAGFLVYVGVNTPPDFTGPETAFSPSLPTAVAWPLPGEGTQSLYIVPRYRDSYGCISQNSDPWIVRLTPSGPIMNPVPSPQNVVAVPKANGNINVLGTYPTITFEDNPADMINVWVGTSPPDTTTVPTYQTPISSTPFSILFGVYTPGTYYVAVALYRSADGFTSGVVLTTVTFPIIPGAPQAVFTDKVTNP